MFLRIKELQEKKMASMSLEMCLAENKTFQLWNRFMIHRKEITNAVSTDLYSIQEYDKDLNFKEFTPQTKFTKIAATEIKDSCSSPYERYILAGGLYAVFLHKGSQDGFQNTLGFIFGKWLPESDYQLDNRVHFELLGAKYKNNDPDSEEEVWIPIKLK